MTSRSELYAGLFSMNAGTLKALARDMGDAEAKTRPGGRQNSFHWLAGHVVTYRARLVGLLGGDGSTPFDLLTAFGKDTSGDVAEGAPRVADLVELMGSLDGRLTTALTSAGDAAFEQSSVLPGGRRIPTVSFLHFHETYHLGQLGYVRTWLGKPPLVPAGPVVR